MLGHIFGSPLLFDVFSFDSKNVFDNFGILKSLIPCSINILKLVMIKLFQEESNDIVFDLFVIQNDYVDLIDEISKCFILKKPIKNKQGIKVKSYSKHYKYIFKCTKNCDK